MNNSLFIAVSDLSVISIVMAIVGFVIALKEMIGIWKSENAATVRAVEPVRLANRSIIAFEGILVVLFIVLGVVVADQRFTFVTASCVLSLCGAIALQALIKFIYRLEPKQ